MNENLQKIYLAAGCFWGVEAYFKKVKGVKETEVGYAGGNTKNPDYKQVCTGKTGHAETLRVEFNPEIISLEEILNHFWQMHDPTSLNKQGNDIGSQYRSAIFYSNENQKKIIIASRDRYQQKINKVIITEIALLDKFYPAEDYHQDYLDKNPGGYCHVDLSLAEK